MCRGLNIALSVVIEGLTVQIGQEVVGVYISSISVSLSYSCTDRQVQGISAYNLQFSHAFRKCSREHKKTECAIFVLSAS